VVTNTHFVGGIYQQVKVTPGNTYYANIVWLAFDSLVNDASVNAIVGGIGRRIGIDPTGGTDSRSSNVIWSEDNWRNDCKICNVEQAVATAQSDTITVFIRIDDTWRLRAGEKGYDIPPSKDQFWLDDIGMKQVDGSMAPPPTEPPPTDTPLPPPTDTPVPASLVDAPEAESPIATPTPAEVAQAEVDEPDQSQEAEVEQPASPLPTPTPVNTIAPPPTLTPSPTRSPTPTSPPTEPPPPTSTRRSRAESSPAETEDEEPPVLSAGVLGAVGTTACVGGLVLLLIGAVLAGLVWLFRLGWGGSTEEDFEDDYYADADNDIIIDLDEP
jgi:hypothetical protein